MADQENQVAPAVAVSPQYVVVPAPQKSSNGLAVFGFLLALIGLFIPTGIVAILGLMISLVALGRPPRGFATAGVVLGLIGSVVWLIIDLLAIVAALLAAFAMVVFGAFTFAVTQPEVVEISSDMINLAMAVQEERDREGETPESILALNIERTALTDPWGVEYEFVRADSNGDFDIISAGADTEFGTEDDIRLSQLDRVWESAFENFGEKMEAFGKRMERLNHNSQYKTWGSCGNKSVQCPQTSEPDAESYESYEERIMRKAQEQLDRVKSKLERRKARSDGGAYVGGPL